MLSTVWLKEGWGTELTFPWGWREGQRKNTEESNLSMQEAAMHRLAWLLLTNSFLQTVAKRVWKATLGLCLRATPAYNRELKTDSKARAGFHLGEAKGMPFLCYKWKREESRSKENTCTIWIPCVDSKKRQDDNMISKGVHQASCITVAPAAEITCLIHARDIPKGAREDWRCSRTKQRVCVLIREAEGEPELR